VHTSNSTLLCFNDSYAEAQQRAQKQNIAFKKAEEQNHK